MDITKLTIKEASELIDKGELSSVDLTNACLSHIKNFDKELNAFISVSEEEALHAATEAGHRAKEKSRFSALDGIPVGIKDVICIEGTKTTAASRILEDFIAPYDATVISKLRASGTVFIGKTNCDEFAMGGSTENSYFGVTKNPYDLERVAGGSSGGSAAAVASGEVLYALGSDTGGSIRQPAAFCGVVGLKPTYGLVSRFGLIAMASSLDQIGTFTKTVEDAAIILEQINDPDALDSTSIVNVNVVGTAYHEQLNSNIKNIRIGVPIEFFEEGLDDAVREKVEAAIEDYKKMGAKVVPVSLPMIKYALATYYIIMPAEVSSNLARYDGIKYGYKAEGRTLEEQYLNSRTEGFGLEAKRRIMLGTYTLSAGYYDAYYKKAQQVRTLLINDFKRVFSEVDALVGPTTPNPAFKIGEKTNDPLSMYLEDMYTVAVNLAGLPAISIPCGKVIVEKSELPVGLQIIGPALSEQTILNVAYAYENRS